MNVKERAEAVATFRHVNVYLMETLAKWVPTTPEMEVKVLFGRHLWLAARLADRLGHRTRELRAPLHHSRLPGEGFAKALDAMASLTATLARVDGFYGPALDAMAKAYAEYVSRTDAVIDEPTVVIIEDGLRDIERMRAQKARLLEELPALRDGEAGGVQELARLFAASGGMVRVEAENQPA